jgi:regulator of protease activity HflC (stomatin/prohibitin superfamily)
MERTYLKNGLINLLMLLAVGAAGFAMARYTHSFAGQVAMVFVGLGFLVTVVSCFQMRLEDRERLEKMEFDELTKAASSAALFTKAESETLLARRSREQFERFFIPIFTILLFVLQGGSVFLLWRWLKESSATTAKAAQTAGAVVLNSPLIALALFGLFALVLFLLGKFAANVARLQKERLLRPSASYLMLNSYLCGAVAVTLAIAEAGFPVWDFYVARALVVLLGVLAAETLIGLVLEIYRPRIQAKAERSLYESRLVGLLGQPEGLITTAAQALDYQFGFKVSETWFYRFLESNLGWILLGQVAVLFLSTSFVIVQSGEQALLERFGEPVAGREIIGPGLHLKLPWPVDKVYRYRTEEIQTVNIGVPDENEKEEKHKEKTIVWAVTHGKEENFLVASHDSPSVETTPDDSAKKSPPVSLLTVSIPVQFQISNLVAWAYNNESPDELLEKLASREVVRYLVNVDLNDMMSRGRWEAAETLRERIQRAADDRQLGVRIIFVGLQDVHPPVKVAKAYESVVGAIHTAKAKILAAEADSIRTNAWAGARAFTITNQAEAERVRREVNALAQAALFTNQIPAFQAARSVYAQRAYLQTFNRAVAGARKYILVATNTHDVVTFNLEDKIRRELTDFDVPAPKTK